MHGRAWAVISLIIAASGIAGCGSVPSLPPALDVPISETETATAQAGTGPSGLANTVWALTRKGDGYSRYGSGTSSGGDGYGGLLRGEPLERPPVDGQVFLVHFGPDGEMVEITENEYLLPEIYGSEVPVGGGWMGTPMPSLTFRSESYGLQDGDHYAVAARFQVRFAGFLLAHATVYSYGEVQDDQAEGTFGYLLDFDDGLLSFMGEIEDDYPVAGQQL